MYSRNKKISHRQLQILLILDILGISAITMPAANAGAAGYGGWILVIGGGLLLVLGARLICLFAEISGGRSFFDTISETLGYPVGVLLSAGLIIKLIFSLSADIRTFSEAAKIWLLPHTPLPLIMAVTLAPCLVGALYGYETRARLGELFVFMILLPFALVYVPYLFRIDYSRLFGNIKWDSGIYFRGSLDNCFAFTGPELLLVSSGYLKDPKKTKPYALSAAALGAALVFLVNFTAINLLGAELCKSLSFPGAELMDVSAFSKGKGAIMMSFFYLSVVIFAIGAIFFSGELLGRLTGVDSRLCRILAALAGFLAGLSFGGMEVLPTVSKSFGLFFGAVYMFILPVITISAYKLRKH